MTRTKQGVINLKQRKMAYLREWFNEHPCVDCGETDIRVLTFDHLKDKVAAINVMLRFTKYSFADLVLELEKGVSRCANHHMIKFVEAEGGWRTNG